MIIYLFSIFFEKIKLNLILVGVSAVLAFFYLTSLDPVYRVETKLNEVQESTVSLEDSALSNLFSVQSSSKNFDMFFWQLNSSQVAKKLWDEGFDEVYYSFAYDEEDDVYRYNSTFGQSLNNFIFDLEPKRSYNHNDLKNLIKNKIPVFFIEKNKPATFTYPFFSLLSDYIMFWEILRGKHKIF